MNSPTKIECPTCGQHYSIELGDEEISLTCQKCGADFTACREPDARPSSPPATQRLPDSSPANHGRGHSRPSLTHPTARDFRHRPGLLDRFMGLLFRFGKGFAGILALVFLVGILISGIVFVTHLRTSLEVPGYDQLIRESSSGAGDGTSGLDKRRALEKAHGDRVARLIKDHRLEEASYDALIGMLAGLDEGNEDDFLDGLEQVLDARAGAISRKDPEIPAARELIVAYTGAFFEAEGRAKGDAAEAKTTRLTALGAATASCFMLFLMLIIPALLRIEENTRRG